MKGLLLFLTICLSSFSNVSFTNKWGFDSHKRINRMAVFMLPEGMFGFYKQHIQFITDHAVDADKRRYVTEKEAPKHYINVDQYITNSQENPFKVIPKSWTNAEKKYGKDTLELYGILPWHIQTMLRKLTFAFEKKNASLILKYSSDIGHYIADAHVPLHTTKNYDGQLTNQVGIHKFWETRIPEVYDTEFNYFVGKATYIKQPLKYTWDIIKESFNAVDSVLGFEKKLSSEYPSDRKYSLSTKGTRTVKTQAEDYTRKYHQMLDEMVERRMKKSIHSIGCYWYTAWVNAGQPNLNELMNTPLVDSLKNVPIETRHLKIKGRKH